MRRDSILSEFRGRGRGKLRWVVAADGDGLPGTHRGEWGRGPTREVRRKVTRRRYHHRGERVAGGGDVGDRWGRGGGRVGWPRMGPVRWDTRGEKPDLPDFRIAHGPWDSASIHVRDRGRFRVYILLGLERGAAMIRKGVKCEPWRVI